MTTIPSNAVTPDATPGSSQAAAARPVLRHLAVIPDGNRRWARARGLPPSAGHRRGIERALDLLGWCRQDEEIETVSFGVVSIENLRRSQEEVAPALRGFAEMVEQIAAGGDWRVRLMGNLDLVPKEFADAVRSSALRTAHTTGPTVNFGIAYGGRDELQRAVRKLLDARETAASDPGPDAPLDLSPYLDTCGQPDPDLVIRTSGEIRLCGFMPWQTVYSELYFSPVLWPDYDEAEFARARDSYHARHRRMGL